jgi:hypothetical protein
VKAPARVRRAAARRSASEVAVADGFMRTTRRCRSCQQMSEVTWRTRPASAWLLAGR